MNKGLVCLLGSFIPIKDSYFLTQIPTNQLTMDYIYMHHAYICEKLFLCLRWSQRRIQGGGLWWLSWAPPGQIPEYAPGWNKRRQYLTVFNLFIFDIFSVLSLSLYKMSLRSTLKNIFDYIWIFFIQKRCVTYSHLFQQKILLSNKEKKIRITI